MIAHNIVAQVPLVRVIAWSSHDERISSTLSSPFPSTSSSSHSSLISCTSSYTSSTTLRALVTLLTSPEKRWTPLKTPTSSHKFNTTFSDPGSRNDQCPAGNFSANQDTNVELEILSISLSLFPNLMSLNIDMKFIRFWNCSGSLILFTNFWTSWTRCNVVNPGKIFHSNAIGSPSIVSKVLCCDESLNQPNCCSQLVFDVGF